MRTAPALLFALVAALGSPASAQTTTIGSGLASGPGTSVVWNSSLGLPQGQTFIVPAGFPVLQEIRFYSALLGPITATSTLTFELYLWNGTAPVGPAVTSLPVNIMVNDADKPFTGSLQLIEGQSYLALLVGGGTTSAALGFDPSGADRYAGGSLVFFDGSAWRATSGREGPYDAYFTATFGTSTVPEPTTVWLMGAGLVGLIGMARRRQANG